MSIQYEDSNITMKYLKRVYPYITPYYIGGGGALSTHDVPYVTTTSAPLELPRSPQPGVASAVPGPIFRHARYIYISTLHTH